MLRRLVLLLCLCLTPALAETWTYDVLQNGRRIGGMVLDLDREGSITTARYRLRFTATVLRIPVFRYDRISTEIWDGDRLVALDGVSQYSGRQLRVSVRREEDGLRISGPRRSRVAPLDAIPASLWHMALVTGRPVFDAQSGKDRHIQAIRLGTDALSVAGRTVAARRWRVDGFKAPLEVWYGPDGAFLRARLRHLGQRFDFVRRA